MSDITDWFSAIVGAGQSIVNLINSERDRNYQKDLQNQIFEREDNAVQRRVADLKAAGLNPNLAAGSAASAGSVVGRSETPKQDFGSALDAISAMNQIKQQSQAVKNAKEEFKILENQFDAQKFENNLNKIVMAQQLGFSLDPSIYYDSNGNLKMDFKLGYVPKDMKYVVGEGSRSYLDRPYRDMIMGSLNNQYDQMKIQTDLLNKDAQWYTADKISGMAFNLLGLGNSFVNWKKLFK